MPNLDLLSIKYNSIIFLPLWIIFMKKLNIIQADANPCYIPTEIGTYPKLSSRPFSLSPKHQIAQPPLVDLAAARIRDYIDKGGDWTPLVDIPDHLMHKIASTYPSRSTQVQILRFDHFRYYVVENVNLELLKETKWRPCGKK